MKHVNESSAPQAQASAPIRRRTALTAGGGALAATWLTGCGPAGGDSGGDGKAPPPRTTTAAPATRTPSPGFSPVAADWPALGSALHGRLVRPKDAAYATDRRLYNTRFDHLRPAAIAHVSGADDIRRCLDFAHRTATTPVVRSGGHSYAGWSSGDGKLVIDVSELNSIRLDGTTATVGAGAKLIDVYATLGKQGRTIPAGSCPSVGVSGLTLGGGHGVMSRSMGLTCDNLIGATLITADGTTHEVSADQEPDIFWALRGAGCGNFGVVTSLRFSTHPVPEVVTGYLTWPWGRAAEVLTAWQGWGPDQPDHLWSALHLDCAPGGSPTVSVAMLSTGSKSDLSAAADRLADAAGAPASSVSLHPHTYLEAMFAYAGCSGQSAAQCHLAPEGHLGRDTYTARSDFYDTDLPAAGVSALLSQVERLASASGGGAGSIALTALGGAVNRVSPTATAFSHRGSRFLAQYLASAALSTTSWLDTTHDAMRRYASGGAYQNYTDPALTDWRTAYYGQNAGRLAALKRTLDPQRLFDFPQAL
ncbi:FAD-binding oxidoreductase [Streptomyces cocklensis]|uniref:FAD/FMN-containing dehydrogenase n=1 Tax=Actinacidiphila cocklensis TaxID=887465 RepID=A0A9W4DLY7_9ACTN|nr:FAD-binding oxidoreductase [Actinacidiphila cocklensis]MDD1061680.1 FAD-binding oxidoreductase [Actinacidiphila cocklensis]WSX77717.1 FAD-binding oxidoreductase [Streptomyces sp. NBC_00899]CAG6392434.1 FAD/FMN-containing dehydrogenase [Actinacidiphila cocklensis]